jgi:sec-independent protein translocase protein TatA
MGLSFGHILIVLVVVLILFGAGKLPQVMGDLGKGLRNFKDGIKSDDDKSGNDKLPPPAA